MKLFEGGKGQVLLLLGVTIMTQAGLAEEKTSGQHNRLSDAERTAGWQLMFDGKSIAGWRVYNGKISGKSIEDKWKAEGGTLHFVGHNYPETGYDIISEDQYRNFELSLEWKVGPGGNSGVMFNVVEGEKYEYPWQTGPEMQLIDNEKHPDGQFPKLSAGALDGLIACSTPAVKPAGEWNSVRIVVDKGYAEHWLNGIRVVEYKMWTEQWKAMVAGSKFSPYADFGKFRSGHISLQDHSDKVWYRNIKIREK